MNDLAEDVLKGLRFAGCCGDDDQIPARLLEQVISANNDDKSILSFCQIVHDIVQCLRKFNPSGEHVQTINRLQEIKVFCCELRELLSELGYPKSFDSNTLNEIICTSAEERLNILDFLNAEQLAAAIVSKRQTTTLSNDSDEILVQKICLCFGLDYNKTSTTQMFKMIESKINNIIKQSSTNAIGAPLLTISPTAKQWEKIDYIYQLLFEDYLARREMWMKRLDVTVQSFLWNNRTKNLEEKIMALYNPMRKQLQSVPNVKISNLLSARDDICVQQKTCATKAGSVIKLKTYMIGTVPDRGGRVNEFEPLSKETFQDQQNQRMPQEQRKSNRGRGRGRGSINGGYGNRGGGRDRDNYFDQRNDPYINDRHLPMTAQHSNYNQPSQYYGSQGYQSGQWNQPDSFARVHSTIDYDHQYVDQRYDPRYSVDNNYSRGSRVQGNWQHDRDQMHRGSYQRHYNRHSRY